MHHLAGDEHGIDSDSQSPEADGHASHARILQTSEDMIQFFVGWCYPTIEIVIVGKSHTRDGQCCMARGSGTVGGYWYTM